MCAAPAKRKARVPIRCGRSSRSSNWPAYASNRCHGTCWRYASCGRNRRRDTGGPRMASVLDNLNAAKANIAVNLAAITAVPKPSYQLDGESYSWSEYYQILTDQMINLDRAIQREA